MVAAVVAVPPDASASVTSSDKEIALNPKPYIHCISPFCIEMLEDNCPGYEAPAKRVASSASIANAQDPMASMGFRVLWSLGFRGNEESMEGPARISTTGENACLSEGSCPLPTIQQRLL